MPEPLIRNISDTAQWAAAFRAQETERRDALFRDPLARRLAGERGEQIASAMTMHTKNAWSWVMRTYVFDQYVERQLGAGVDTVLNLAAGLDARPYRMDVSPTLRWIEVDLPDLLAYKEEILAGERPRCVLERIPMDLSDVARRRALFSQIGATSKRVLIISEGLLVYLSAEDVGSRATADVPLLDLRRRVARSARDAPPRRRCGTGARWRAIQVRATGGSGSVPSLRLAAAPRSFHTQGREPGGTTTVAPQAVRPLSRVEWRTRKAAMVRALSFRAHCLRTA